MEHRLKYGARSPKFIRAPCTQLYSLAETPKLSPLLHPAFVLINEGAIGQGAIGAASVSTAFGEFNCS